LWLAAVQLGPGLGQGGAPEFASRNQRVEATQLFEARNFYLIFLFYAISSGLFNFLYY
jgi:hypothetical protein